MIILVWVMVKTKTKAGLAGLVCLITSMPLLADSYRLAFDPGIALPEIAVESAKAGFTNKKQSVYMRKRIANRLSVTSEGGMGVGLLRYRGQSGKSKYGLGYRNQFSSFELNTIVNKNAIVFAVEKDNVLYNVQLKTVEPELNRNAAFIEFSLTGNF